MRRTAAQPASGYPQTGSTAASQGALRVLSTFSRAVRLQSQTRARKLTLRLTFSTWFPSLHLSTTSLGADITSPSTSQYTQETPAAEGQAGTQSRSQTFESAEQHPSQPAGSQPFTGSQRDESQHTTGDVAKHPGTAAARPAHPGVAAEEKEGEKRAGEKTSTTTTGAAPSVGDKIVGATQKAVGKVTDDPSKVAEGQARKTEGKAAAAEVREARAA